MSNTHESPGWRIFLEAAIADPTERQRIARILGVNQISLIRWASGTSNPRLKHLYALLEALPDHREKLIEMIAVEFPQFRADVAVIEEMPQEIPSSFYAKILEAYNQRTKHLRIATIRSMILQQMLSHLDARQDGVAIYASQCTRPQAGKKVRSLRIIDGRGNPPWHAINSNVRFYGLESQIGYAVQTKRPIVIHKHLIKKQWFPVNYNELAESIVAYPLIHANQIAGCMTLISPKPQHFSDVHMELIRRYVDLFMLSFESSDLYDFEQIALGVMPSSDVQEAILEEFNSRATQLIIEASKRGLSLTRPEAEKLLWPEIEQELLDIAAGSSNEMPPAAQPASCPEVITPSAYNLD
ncbi:GAF domain-containing protein [Dictyobacter aurantiacus]|uniref:GAF domain-containing protein n=1 Tax=Dictyobacter aurantiacus TaxID=1936993 RepID=A0A401ZRW8_9CHLR|nr:GAF domain-containing protein [Dictyobacter aurantiacus]GCE09615.1 hypothetical protein KDAU_69440 [Dictyobacter aurantiacus]